MNNKAVNTMLRLLVVTIISLLAWNASIFLGIVTYDQTNDDAALNLIAAGAFGKPCQEAAHRKMRKGRKA